MSTTAETPKNMQTMKTICSIALSRI